MAADKFQFVSPGVQINEIDESIIQPASPEVGPVIIGRTATGPLMQPVKVSSVAELEKVFGPATNGNTTGIDIWRTSLPTAPTFGTYAAQAFLRNSAPVTVIRLGGVKKGTGQSGECGWATDKCYQLIASGASGQTLAANIYTKTATTFKVSGSDVERSASAGDYGLVTTGSGGNVKLTIGTETYNVKLGGDNVDLIRNKLSTDPTAYSAKNYFLGESYEDSVGTYSKVYVTASADFASMQKDPSAASSGWVLGVSSSAAEPAQLFKVHALGEGEAAAKEYKISIENMRPSRNTNVTKYGTFDLYVRPLRDNAAVQVLESHAQLTLDPRSDRYIAKVIGDMKRVWNATDKNYVENGTYPNNSRYIRIEMGTDNAAETDLPHGFQILGMPSIAGGAATHPSIPLKTDYVRASNARTYRFGLKAEQTGNRDLVDVLRIKPNYVEANQKVFHLLHLSQSGNNGTVSGSFLKYVPGYSSSYDWAIGLPSGSVAGFDMPLFGGSDGTDITYREPIVNSLLLDAQSEVDGAAYRSVKTAIDMVSDPEFIEYDLVAIPNLKNPYLVTDLVEVCKARGDALAIVDVKGDYTFPFETTNNEAVMPSKNAAIETITELQLDNSYGAAYFPAVYVPSEATFMPASIAALGSYAGTEARSAVWFAPAGFNRGGLTVGSSGIGVSRTALALNASARDDLYAVNINPIATFPGEGVVIFGQKTLQFTPSALDRVNVRRLMNFLKKQISRAAVRVLFEPNVKSTWDSFKAVVEPFLLSVKNAYGLDDAKIVLDETTTTADLVDRNIMYCKLYVKPTRAIEYVAIDFIVTNSGAAFAE